MKREDAIAAIAEILHSYDHSQYDTVAYCVFCDAMARKVIDELPEDAA
jgi:hypothetical protein